MDKLAIHAAVAKPFAEYATLLEGRALRPEPPNTFDVGNGGVDRDLLDRLDRVRDSEQPIKESIAAIADGLNHPDREGLHPDFREKIKTLLAEAKILLGNE